MKKYTSLFTLVFVVSLATAQSATRPLAMTEDVGRVIDSATVELLLITDTFRNETLAEAVRQALLERGVTVYVLAPSSLVMDLSSYFGTLALAGAEVRLQETSGAFLVVDRQYVVQGPLLSALEAVPQSTLTLFIANETYAEQLTQRFIEAFEGGEPWTYKAP